MSEQQRAGDVGPGFSLAFLLHIVFQASAYFILLAVVGDGVVAEMSALVPLSVIGLSQLVYLGPTWLLLRKRGDSAMAKGVAIVVALTFLLNAGCFGLMVSLT